jgi:hypothetical protein
VDLRSQPAGVQHLLERAQWDADAARDVLRDTLLNNWARVTRY